MIAAILWVVSFITVAVWSYRDGRRWGRIEGSVEGYLDGIMAGHQRGLEDGHRLALGGPSDDPFRK